MLFAIIKGRFHFFNFFIPSGAERSLNLFEQYLLAFERTRIRERCFTAFNMTIGKLALINVVYENYTVLDGFLDSLRKQTNKNYFLYNIDVSPQRKIIKLDGIAGITIPAKNKGYAHGINCGLKNALKDGYKYFCILNNDIYFEEDFVKKCIKSTSSHVSAIIGGKIYYAPGYEYHQNRYKKSDLGKIIWYAGGFVDWNHAMTPHIGVDEIDKGQFDKFKKIDFVNGSLMLYDKSVHEKIGFWNESYFLYFEDADFCVRAKRAGINLYFDPSIVIWHKISQSTGGSGSPIHQKFQNKNRLKFGLKYAPFRTKLHLLKNYLLNQYHSAPARLNETDRRSWDAESI